MIEIIPNWHPIFVHFTVALLSVSLGLFILSLVVKSEQLVVVAKWNLWLGAGTSLLTLAAGIYAYNTVVHDTPSHEAMTQHRNLAFITLALLVPVVIWSMFAQRKRTQLGVGFVALFVLVGGMLASTAWHGGEVVYRYGIGVISLPNVDSHDHDGHHGDEKDAGDAHHDLHSDHHATVTAEPLLLDDDMDMSDLNMDSMKPLTDEAN